MTKVMNEIQHKSGDKKFDLTTTRVMLMLHLKTIFPLSNATTKSKRIVVTISNR